MHGPEADHYRALVAGGLIRNTPQAAERIQREIEIANIRGVTPSDRCTNCKEPIERNAAGELSPICARCGVRNGLPELKPRTTAEVRRLWARDLAGGENAVRQRELDARRDEVGQLREAVKEGNRELVEALRQIISERNVKDG
jgi:hypothetical protein